VAALVTATGEHRAAGDDLQGILFGFDTQRRNDDGHRLLLGLAFLDVVATFPDLFRDIDIHVTLPPLIYALLLLNLTHFQVRLPS